MNIKLLAVKLLSFYLRNTPKQFFRYSIVTKCIPILRQYGYQLPPATVKARNNFNIHVSLDDWLGQYVYLTGDYEASTTAVFKQLLHKGDTFIDIGANIGYFSLLAGQLCGNTGKVISFEASPIVYKQLLNNIQLNSYSITPYNLAISNKPDKLSFYQGPKNHSGISSLRPILNPSQVIEVEAKPLDNILDKEQSINLIKIDIEGAEQLAIEGMIDLLKFNMPHIILEVTDNYLKSFNHSAESLSKLLTGMGYNMYIISEFELIQVNDFNFNKNQFNALFTTSLNINKKLDW